MPSFPIIDAHLHLWDPAVLRYPWLDDIPLLNRPFLPEDYKAATEGLHVEKMVFVQCECEFSQCEEEVNFITRLAEADKRIEGIVAWAPLEKGIPATETLERFSTNKLVKGIRRIIQFEPDPEFCLRKDFIEALRLLPRYGFSFDICISHRQMENVIKLVRECPEVRFVLDHIGKPGIKQLQTDPWRSNLKTLSGFENVWCKMSGLVTEADHAGWKKEDLATFCKYVLDYFTPDRLIFGGDWPVVLQAADYVTWIETLDFLLSGLSQNELLKIYRQNAETFYGL